MNTELAEQVISKILMEPETLSMDTWLDGVEGDTAGDLRRAWPCGTTACIAGHAVVLSAPDDLRFWTALSLLPDGAVLPVTKLSTGENIESVARQELGLPEDVTDVLFHVPDDADEAVQALKFLIGNPDATGADLWYFLDEGRSQPV